MTLSWPGPSSYSYEVKSASCYVNNGNNSKHPYHHQVLKPVGQVLSYVISVFLTTALSVVIPVT